MITGEALKFYTVKDVPAGVFIRKYAEYLKKNDKIELPKVLTLNIFNKRMGNPIILVFS